MLLCAFLWRFSLETLGDGFSLNLSFRTDIYLYIPTVTSACLMGMTLLIPLDRVMLHQLQALSWRKLPARWFSARYICCWSLLSTATCASPSWIAPALFLYFVEISLIAGPNFQRSPSCLRVFSDFTQKPALSLSLLSLIKDWTELYERQGPVGSHLIFASILTENSWQVFWEVVSNHYCTQFIAI